MSGEILLVPGKLPASSPAAVQAPPSKSITHRSLIAVALAAGASRLRQALESEDTCATSGILRALGAEIRAESADLLINGLAGKIEHRGKEPLLCNVHESGTTCRLLAAVLAAGQGSFRFAGSGRMCRRPMGELTRALAGLGAEISFAGEPGCLPFVLRASGLRPAELEIDISRSSQYLSGLLLAAPLTSGLKLIPTAAAGEEIVSWSYVQLTLQILEAHGINFTVEQRACADAPWQPAAWRSLSRPGSGLCRICVEPGTYRSGVYEIEGDFSNASYLLAAGAAGRRPVRVNNLAPDSLQGDRVIMRIIEQMGGKVRILGRAVEVSPPDGALQGIDINMGDCPDLVPTVAVMAAFAKGTTRISGVAHLRIKESDRIAAPAAELARTGCVVHAQEDGLVIIPPDRLTPPAAPFETYNDHRMAMSLALFSCAGFSVQIRNPACVAKSFPDFWKVWELI